MSESPTIVVLHEHAGVLELIEAALRDRGARVLGTLDAFEAEDVRWTDLSAVALDDEPMRLDEIAGVAVSALPPCRERP
jgi:hypothetical protein